MLHAGYQQRQFDHLVGTADRLHAETENVAASVAVLRAALLICANCTATRSKGHFSEEVFVFDDFPDRRYLSDAIFPALAQRQTQQILWVGVQVGSLAALGKVTSYPLQLRSCKNSKHAQIRV